jgi:hypothetical protein
VVGAENDVQCEQYHQVVALRREAGALLLSLSSVVIKKGILEHGATPSFADCATSSAVYSCALLI